MQLKLRIISIQQCNIPSFQCKNQETLDFTQSEFSRDTKLANIPQIKIYGHCASTGKSAILCIHNIFSYFFLKVTWKGNKPDNLSQQDLANDPKSDLDSDSENDLSIALLLGALFENHMGKGTVYKIAPVLARSMNGYCPQECKFFKVALSSPYKITQAAELASAFAHHNGNLEIVPFEVHVPWRLQVMMDFGLYGMDWLQVSHAELDPVSGVYHTWPQFIINRKALVKRAKGEAKFHIQPLKAFLSNAMMQIQGGEAANEGCISSIDSSIRTADRTGDSACANCEIDHQSNSKTSIPTAFDAAESFWPAIPQSQNIKTFTFSVKQVSDTQTLEGIDNDQLVEIMHQIFTENEAEDSDNDGEEDNLYQTIDQILHQSPIAQLDGLLDDLEESQISHLQNSPSLFSPPLITHGKSTEKTPRQKPQLLRHFCSPIVLPTNELQTPNRLNYQQPSITASNSSVPLKCMSMELFVLEGQAPILCICWATYSPLESKPRLQCIKINDGFPRVQTLLRRLDRFHTVEDEPALISCFIQAVQEFDPDVLTAFRIDQSQSWNYLYQRISECKYRGIDANSLSRDYKCKQQQKLSNNYHTGRL